MKDKYVSPLTERYGGEKMSGIFSDDYKFTTFRKLWIALAEAEQELKLNITDEQIDEMKQNVGNIDYKAVGKYEKQLRHDVMAHILTFGDCAKKAKPIIHLGATSCYVNDNTEIIQIKAALTEIKTLLLNVINELSRFADSYKALPCLSYTHLQAAQPTTLGKRATLWLSDLLKDLDRLDFELDSLEFFGCKGATGTAASFLELFDGDTKKVLALEKIIAQKFGFGKITAVSGQTYSRKTDSFVLNVLAGICQSAYKFSNDIRMLCSFKEVDEPFESKQVGSSAMPYKRNPMRSERLASLSRYVICTSQNAVLTTTGQFFERTLDDSANRRMSIPEAFLSTDGVLRLYLNVITNLVVYPKVIEKRLTDELPFMATENVLMYAVKNKGKDRQTLHERLRVHSLKAGEQVKVYGKQNDLLKRIAKDKEFGITENELNDIVSADNLCGMAKEQTELFLSETVKPVLQANAELLNVTANIDV